jgi:hypothetical protein
MGRGVLAGLAFVLAGLAFVLAGLACVARRRRGRVLG